MQLIDKEISVEGLSFNLCRWTRSSGPENGRFASSCYVTNSWFRIQQHEFIYTFYIWYQRRWMYFFSICFNPVGKTTRNIFCYESWGGFCVATCFYSLRHQCCAIETNINKCSLSLFSPILSQSARLVTGSYLVWPFIPLLVGGYLPFIIIFHLLLDLELNCSLSGIFLLQWGFFCLLLQ